MTSAGEVSQILSAADPAVRVLYFAALLARDSGLGTDRLIVVGGSAVEIYTRGGYSSGDIDIVADRDRVIPVVKGWGFERASRQLWYRKTWGITVDFVKDFDRYNGSQERTQVIQTPYGNVRIEAVEDSLVRRLIQAKHRHVAGDFDWAVALAKIHSEDIDWEYVQATARQEFVDDLLTALRERLHD